MPDVEDEEVEDNHEEEVINETMFKFSDFEKVRRACVFAPCSN